MSAARRYDITVPGHDRRLHLGRQGPKAALKLNVPAYAVRTGAAVYDSLAAVQADLDRVTGAHT